MGERLERLWPSLVALVGTVAVVLGLLWMFGGEVNDSTPDDVAAGDESGGEGTSPADETGDTNPVGSPNAESGQEPTGDESPPESTEPPTDEPTANEPTTAPPELREPVGIANQTSVAGLAEQAQQRLQEGGWEVPAVSDFNGTVPETTVYYPEGMQEAAEALAAQFPEIGRVQPTFEGLNPTRLVVVLADDYVDEVGAPE